MKDEIRRRKDEWPKKPLGELLSFLTSGSRGWAEYYREMGDVFLRIQNVGRNQMLLNDVAYVEAPDSAEAKRTLVQPGDVLLSITADLGRTGVVPETLGKAYINQHLAILRVKGIHPHFLSAFLASPEGQKQVMGRNKHAVKAGLNFEDIRSFQIPLPPLAEQRRIAEVLDRAEALRAKRRAALAELDSLTQSLFLDLFGDPFKNPRGWPTFPFSEVCETTQGVQIPRDEQKEGPAQGYERYLYINDFYSDDSPKYIEDRFPQKRVTDDVLVMANTGSPGRVFKGRPGILSNNLFKIAFDTGKISTVFFYHFLASDLFQRHLQGQMKQGIQSHLGHKTFGVQKLPLPPIALQQEFARRVGAVEKLKQAQRAALAEQDALFATLQHRAFRGEL